ncbi:MAG: hypothetical protein HY056_16945, partial [Proteobacteria bacterium]|nr:hypothetical protein [Pseudomonadota bacterium]
LELGPFAPVRPHFEAFLGERIEAGPGYQIEPALVDAVTQRWRGAAERLGYR